MAPPTDVKECQPHMQEDGLESLQIILGSSSATRQAILKEMGFDFVVVEYSAVFSLELFHFKVNNREEYTSLQASADIDESLVRREKPEDLVMALAEAKAQAILAKLAASPTTDLSQNSKTTLLITADQVVVHEGNIREKPRTVEEARHFIEGYSRSPANTVGAVLVTNLTTGATKGGVDRTEIYFHPIPDQVINTLIEEGSVFWSAGGLLVEHPLVSPLVNAMVGSIDSVMGLPKELTSALINEALQTKNH